MSPSLTVQSKSDFTVAFPHRSEADAIGICRTEAIIAINKAEGKAASSLERKRQSKR
jgi:hypothetical protein